MDSCGSSSINPGAPSQAELPSWWAGKPFTALQQAARRGAACRRSMAIHAAIKLILGCHLVRLKFSSLGRLSVTYANKAMQSHKICKEGHLSVWHNLQLSEPSDTTDTCRRKCSPPYSHRWQRGRGRVYLLQSASSPRIRSAPDRKDNAFCATLNLLCYSSGCLIL